MEVSSGAWRGLGRLRRPLAQSTFRLGRWTFSSVSAGGAQTSKLGSSSEFRRVPLNHTSSVSTGHMDSIPARRQWPLGSRASIGPPILAHSRRNGRTIKDAGDVVAHPVRVGDQRAAGHHSAAFTWRGDHRLFALSAQPLNVGNSTEGRFTDLTLGAAPVASPLRLSREESMEVFA